MRIPLKTQVEQRLPKQFVVQLVLMDERWVVRAGGQQVLVDYKRKICMISVSSDVIKHVSQ